MAFSNENGQIEEELSYDAWGRRRSPSTWEPFTFSDDDTSDYDQGFTGHEHIDLFDMVNMDGRMYDPVVGRFLSPDPYIQMPDFTQSLNRYAYCINNPLSLTDPTGYNWFGDFFAVAVGIAVGIETGGLGAGIYGAIIGGTLGGASAALVGSVLNGANLWQTTKNVFVGAFWGAAGGAMNFEIGEIRNVFARIAVHSVSEGVVEGIQGGHFEHGLLLGLTSSAGGELISRYGSNLPYAGQIAANATLGGLVSELGGGKFANGAMTAAYTMMFNDLMHQGGDDPVICEIGGVVYRKGVDGNWHVIGERGLELVSPEFDILGGLRGVTNIIKSLSSYILESGRSAIITWLNEVESLTPSQLRTALKEAGFKRLSTKSEHYQRGNIKIRLDGPHSKTPYNHMHIEYKKQSYDVHLNKVDRKSPNAHIRIQ